MLEHNDLFDLEGIGVRGVFALELGQQDVPAWCRTSQIERHSNHCPRIGPHCSPFCARHAIEAVLVGRNHDVVSAGLAQTRQDKIQA